MYFIPLISEQFSNDNHENTSWKDINNGVSGKLIPVLTYTTAAIKSSLIRSSTEANKTNMAM